MELNIENGINSLLPILYDSSNELNTNRTYMGLRLFKLEDKYIIYNKELDKSIELNREDYWLDNGKFFPRKSVLPVTDCSLKDIIQSEVIFKHRPCVYVSNKKYSNISNVFNLDTFEYDKEACKKLVRIINNFKLAYYLDGLSPFIVGTIIGSSLIAIFRG